MTSTVETVPMFMTGHALKSLRDSGYTLAAAVAEVIDNSIEARANTINLRLDEELNQRGKKHIHRIVMSDDGTGMDEYVLHHYLQLGYSTRYMRRDTIGKYGVGATLAALNYANRVDVWSRTHKDNEWLHVYFDLEEAMQQEATGKPVGIHPPVPQAVPEEFSSLISKGSGTVVVWSKVDRLEEGRRAASADVLRVEVEKELSRIFRYFLEGGIEIKVNHTNLLPHDPLFLMEGTWADKTIVDYRKRVSEASERIPSEKDHFEATVIAREPISIAGKQVMLTVTLYPEEVTRKRGSGGDALAKSLRITESQGAISFVRLKREINYTVVPRIFPVGIEDRDRFLGIEVAFDPELDEFFGVRNVKRGVEPDEELRKLIKDRLNKYIREARNKIEERWGEAARKDRTHKNEHNPIIEAVTNADRTMPKGRNQDTLDEQQQQQSLIDLAKDVVGADKKAQEEYVNHIRNLPFVIESVDFPGTQFIDIQHINNQVLIRLNTRHRFYREMWEPLKFIADREPGTVSGDEAVRAARRTIESLTLLIVAYGKAESMDESPMEHYGDLRMFWGQFLDSLLGKIKDVL